jgi:hypothetical protein
LLWPDNVGTVTTVAHDDAVAFTFDSFKEASFNVNDATTQTRLLNDCVCTGV